MLDNEEENKIMKKSSKKKCDHSHDNNHSHNHSHDHSHKNDHSHNNDHVHSHNNCKHDHNANKKNFNSTHTKSTNENIKAMIIHLIFDVISSIIVLISCFIVKYYKIYFFDPLCCLIVSILILYTTYPIFKKSFSKIKNKRLNFGIFYDGKEIDVFEVNTILNKRFVVFECGDGDYIYLDLPDFLEKGFQEEKKLSFCKKYGFKDVLLKLED